MITAMAKAEMGWGWPDTQFLSISIPMIYFLLFITKKLEVNQHHKLLLLDQH